MESSSGKQVGVVHPLATQENGNMPQEHHNVNADYYLGQVQSRDLYNGVKDILDQSKVSEEQMGIVDSPEATFLGFIKSFTQVLPEESRPIVVPCLAITFFSLALTPNFIYLVLASSFVSVFCYLVKKICVDPNVEKRLAAHHAVNEVNKRSAEVMNTTIGAIGSHRIDQFLEFNRQTLEWKSNIMESQRNAFVDQQKIDKDKTVALAKINSPIEQSRHNLQLKLKEITQAQNMKSIEENSKAQIKKMQIDGSAKLYEEKTKQMEIEKSIQRDIALEKELTARNKITQDTQKNIVEVQESNNTARAKVNASLAESEALCNVALEGAKNGIKYNVYLNRE
ncbi:uncharacterized protein LOC110862896 isoform X2 [Folsomia candida]|nr:uncharacterized protein LOC110862896 isoform X2 [Folsomia candida]